MGTAQLRLHFELSQFDTLRSFRAFLDLTTTLYGVFHSILDLSRLEYREAQPNYLIGGPYDPVRTSSHFSSPTPPRISTASSRRGVCRSHRLCNRSQTKVRLSM